MPGRRSRHSFRSMSEAAVTAISPRGASRRRAGGFERALVGYDGSDGARDALALTRLLAVPFEAEVLAVAVIPYGAFPVGFARLEGAAARQAEPLFDDVRRELEGLTVETQAFGGGSPAWVMSDYAERGEVDLIVVGSPHRGAIGRILLGSVANSLLHGAPCPVAVAPRGFSDRPHDPLRVIAVAYDGTAESTLALKRAEAIAETTGATLRLLTAVRPPAASIVPGSAGYVPAYPPDPEGILDGGLRSVGPRVKVEGQRLDGPAAPTLAAACEDGIDLLVVGSRGYGPALRVILGSTSSALARTSPCPLLVAPRGD